MRARVLLIALAGLVVGGLIGGLLVTIAVRQQEARQTFFRVVEVQDDEPNPAVWGRNFPNQYEAYVRTERTSDYVKYSPYGRYGGSESFDKLKQAPDLKVIFAGNAFSVEYREEQGHLQAVRDVQTTKRLGDAKPGTCMTCKSSDVPRLMKTIGAAQFYATPMKELVAKHDIKHPISCADCHDARTMALRVTRPAFVEAMRTRGVDVARASRQEMRTYVCAQCHVEYYFRGQQEKYLVFPWAKGLTIDSIEAYYDEIKFSDFEHKITKAPMLKMQHPEYELWSTGIHARSGVGCADCHMPYKRVGAVKITDHWIRSPLTNIANTCMTCHRQTEAEMRARVLDAQERTFRLMKQAESALVDAIRAIEKAMADGVKDEGLAEARAFHRRAQARWDFISAENSMGFHSPQEAVRVLGDAIDYARRAEIAALRAPRPKP
ncbi:MAG: ammonia-forming cytochrome c nitrite reductase subunit c552 [Armatimonadota bacterium]|nr:ammonia-forming cytochrome c nitrite reductase subunit c552 [Armatimonadota bacterium]